jgi:hypothetical protein
MSVLSFGVSSIPLYLTLPYSLIMVFKCSLDVFLKIMMFSKGFSQRIVVL